MSQIADNTEGNGASVRRLVQAMRGLMLCGLLSLAACSSGGGSGSGASSGGAVASAASPPPPTAAEASRFLTQATFGPNDASISALTNSTYSAWLASQVAMAPSASHLAHVDSRYAQLKATNPNVIYSGPLFYESFWAQAATAPDQLRQRVKLALSEIFVTSFSDSNENVWAMADYYDMLGRDAFGNFRQLLTDVTYHPAMGIFLTYAGNQKENATTGTSPDQNYAREIMQLMTIGLYQLNSDGTQTLDGSGKPIPTYTTADIQGLAKVFTGLSYYSATPTATTFFYGGPTEAAYTNPMIAYNSYHSVSAKTFLGVTIPATTTPDANADIKTALDTLFNNANVGPFIAKQLIQRLVTSNPTPAYVGRVAAVFNNNGSGVRGDLSAVVTAILLDNEARSATIAAGADYGKLREPMVRLGNWMRAFETTSNSGNWPVYYFSDVTQLAQAPQSAGSVFNFYRPGYVPPNTTLASKGMVAPEFQITNEATVAGYLNYMQGVIAYGAGAAVNATTNDVQSAYTKELALASNPTSLVARMNLLLYYGQMPQALQTKIVNALNTITPSSTNSTDVNMAYADRVKLAIFLSMASPEYLTQR